MLNKMAGRDRYPEEGELVLCTVKSVKNFGAFVTLDEYGDKEGFIHIREISSGWVKNIRDHAREGQKKVCKVLKVAPERGHIDLSLKQVNEHQRREKIQRWRNANKGVKLFEIVAQRLGIETEAAYEEFGYDLMDVFGDLYQAFEEVAMDETILEEEGFKGDWTQTFLDIARENIEVPYVKIEGFVEIKSYAPDGVERVREALLSAEKEDEEAEVSITAHYLGAPKYRLVCRAPDYKVAEEELRAAGERAVEKIIAAEGEGRFWRKD